MTSDKNKSEPKMEIIIKKISELIPADYNPRHISDEALSGLTTSMREFGCVQPVIWNKQSGNIVGGHQRLKVLKDKNIKETEVVVVDLSPEREKVLNVALNNRHIQGDWTLGLESLLAEIKFETPDLYIDLNLDSLELDVPEIPEPLPGEGNTDPDAVPEVTEEPVIKTGDLITLGKHRLLCGDSTDIEDVERLMAGEKADMVFTDPPYGINLDTDYESAAGKNKRGNNYSKVIGDDRKFDARFIFEIFGYCKEIFLWGANYYADTIPCLNISGWLVWDKRLQRNKDTGFAGEFELCYSRQKHKQEIMEFEWFRFFGLQKEDIKKRVHPTQKPVSMCSYMIDKFSENNNIVADLFLGSGSTLIACETTNRICRGIEIDPEYIQVCIQRWVDFTGKPEDITIERDGKKISWTELK